MAGDALGERFRAAREARKLSLSDVADKIRIRSVYLAAIEEENWNAIGPAVYVRGFLRTYARFLGFDPEEAVAAFSATQPAQPAGPGSMERKPAPESRLAWGPVLLWIAGAVAVVLIAFVVYNELTLRSGQSVAGIAPASATPSSAPSAAPTAAPTHTPAAFGANTLALVFSETSWLRVTVDGSVSMEGTFPAGTTKTFHGKNALVRIGNAGGVEVYVNGKDLGKLGKPGDVVDHAFTL